MRQAIIILIILWASVVLLVSCTRADNIVDYNEFFGDQVYSVYLEKANYIYSLLEAQYDL